LAWDLKKINMKITTIQSAFDEIQILIKDFEAGYDHFMSASYQEAEVRQTFIDKFYDALGWDIYHNYQKNPFEQEVKIEKAQKQAGATGQKRADYAFFLAPNYKQVQFFVEAKKPSRTLLQNKEDYFQTAKYGWNAGTGVSILTDFEEIVIIDCRFVPDLETILNTKIKYYKYTDFKDFDTFYEFYWIFSHEALVAGNLPKFIEQLPKPKTGGKQLHLFGGKYQSIDETFLKYIEAKRFEMALAFYKTAINQDDYTITNFTQKTIDRIVFIRFLEDKNIEPNTIINEIGTHAHPWRKFIEYSKLLNTKYNGRIFTPSFIDNPDFEGPDEDAFRSFCSEIDHTNSPYDFNYIPIYILGSIYERFLGKIVVIDNGRASIEDKPEVRKAGGVFYTPKYIVDYIVENTIGKLIKTEHAPLLPKEIAELSFADIACGSGSFLIGVYDYLLDYHIKFYNNNHDIAVADGCRFSEDSGFFVLTIKQKQEILLNNIYGVDVDFQAIEVTQLSLFLKMLETETMTTVNDMKTVFKMKVLPDLKDNLIAGNSLVGMDIMEYKLDLDLREERKLNVFNFNLCFKKVFKKGGFDAIVGNPPYVNVENIDSITKEYLFRNYKTCKGRTDIYIPFIEKSMSVLKPNGIYSIIIPFPYTNQTYGMLSRKKLIEEYNVSKIVDLSEYYVFKDAVVKTIILVAENNHNPDNNTIIIKPANAENFISKKYSTFSIPQKSFIENKNYRFETKDIIEFEQIKNKLLTNTTPLENICLIAYGARLNHKTENLQKKHFVKSNYIDGYKPFTEGKNIERYHFTQNGWLDYQPEAHYNSMFPELFESEKLMFINIVNGRIRFCYDDKGFYNSHTVINCVKIENLKKSNHPSAKKILARKTNVKYKEYNIKFILGLVNSDLINWYFLNYLSEDLHFYPNDAKSLPIPILTSENKEIHDKIVALTDQMIENKKQIITQINAEIYERKIEYIEDQINQLVYQLYGLTEDEIATIEKD
jgi:adenine-specific DNA-methyltransferase